jgi:hypothetical protein
MTKQKGQPKTFFQYLVDEYILFRRDFLFMPHDTPEILAKTLDNLDYEKKNGQRERRIQAHIVKVENQWHFEIVAEQPVNQKNRENTPNQSGYNPTASATGIIYLDDDGKTLMEGTVAVAGFKFWAGLGFSVLAIILFATCASVLDSSANVFFGVIPIFLIMMAFYWFQMYQDRNHLLKMIQNAVESAHEYSDKAKTS